MIIFGYIFIFFSEAKPRPPAAGIVQNDLVDHMLYGRLVRFDLLQNSAWTRSSTPLL